MSKESFVDTFTEKEPKAAKAEPKAKEPKEPVEMLVVGDCETPEIYTAYVNFLASVQPLVLKLEAKASGYTAQEVWEKMNNAARERANKAFQKKSKRAGTGKAKVETAKNPEHAKAIDLKNTIEKGMYAYAEKTFPNELEELQSLNPDAPLTFEIYAKGWKKFTELWKEK